MVLIESPVQSDCTSRGARESRLMARLARKTGCACEMCMLVTIVCRAAFEYIYVAPHTKR